MEGNLGKKRLSKKKFSMKLPELESRVSTDIPSPSENASKHSNSSTHNSENEAIKPDEKMNYLPLSQCSTQPSIFMDTDEVFRANERNPKENEKNINFLLSEEKLEKTDLLANIKQNSSLYTLEESDAEDDRKGKTGDFLIGIRENKIYTEEESDKSDLDESDSNEIDLPIKRKKSYKRINPVPLKIFNKLVDLKQDSFIEPAETINLAEDEEITISPKQKSINSSFLDKFKQNKVEKSNIILAKAILTDTSQHESLEITAPKNLEGFTMKRQRVNPRELLRESLKAEINQRKTTHINPEEIFSKPVTDLLGKQTKKEENEDSDYVPDNNEEQEAMEMEKMIKLEEGSIDESSLSKDTEEDSKSLKQENGISDSQEKQNDENFLSIEKEEFMDIDSKSDTSESEAEDSEKTEESEPNTNLSAFAITPNPPIFEKVFSKPVKNNKFVENEAEVGSDHEEHDDVIKNYKDSEDEESDKDLEELLDKNIVDDNEEVRYNKHLNQLIEEDQIQINKVINAEFKRNRKDTNFIDGVSNIYSKKQQLLEDKKNLLAQRGTSFFSKNPETSKNEEMDDEEFHKFRVLQGSHELKFIRNQFNSKSNMDEQSLSLLSLISKPENTVSVKSILSTSEKPSGIAVFKTDTNFSSNRSFVFSKGKEKNQTFEGLKRKKTKLFKLINN